MEELVRFLYGEDRIDSAKSDHDRAVNVERNAPYRLGVGLIIATILLVKK